MNIGFFLVFVKDILMKLNDPTLGVNSGPTPRSAVDAGMFILEELSQEIAGRHAGRRRALNPLAISICSFCQISQMFV